MNIRDKILDFPLIQGGMGVGISLGGLAGAVMKEGCMGVISAAHPGFMREDFDANPEIMRPNESKDSAPFNGNNQTPMYQEGCVYEANGAYITLSNEKSGGTYDFSFNNLRLYGAGTTNIICYDMNTNEISVISGSEIYTKRTDGDSADYVVLRQNNYAPAAIFVYRRMEGWQ